MPLGSSWLPGLRQRPGYRLPEVDMERKPLIDESGEAAEGAEGAEGAGEAAEGAGEVVEGVAESSEVVLDFSEGGSVIFADGVEMGLAEAATETALTLGFESLAAASAAALPILGLAALVGLTAWAIYHEVDSYKKRVAQAHAQYTEHAITGERAKGINLAEGDSRRRLRAAAVRLPGDATIADIEKAEKEHPHGFADEPREILIDDKGGMKWVGGGRPPATGEEEEAYFKANPDAPKPKVQGAINDNAGKRISSFNADTGAVTWSGGGLPDMTDYQEQVRLGKVKVKGAILDDAGKRKSSFNADTGAVTWSGGGLPDMTDDEEQQRLANERMNQDKAGQFAPPPPRTSRRQRPVPPRDAFGFHIEPYKGGDGLPGPGGNGKTPNVGPVGGNTQAPPPTPTPPSTLPGPAPTPAPLPGPEQPKPVVNPVVGPPAGGGGSSFPAPSTSPNTNDTKPGPNKSDRLVSAYPVNISTEASDDASAPGGGASEPEPDHSLLDRLVRHMSAGDRALLHRGRWHYPDRMLSTDQTGLIAIDVLRKKRQRLS